MGFRKNDIVIMKVQDIGNEGEGIGKVDGFTVFVKDAIVGDVVEARIVKCMKNYAYGRLEKVLEPSPFRVEPKCAFHRQCGGCQIQALSYERQLAFKQEKIRNHLIRIGGFAPEDVDAKMEPMVGMEVPYHYRNKAQYPIGTDREGNLIAGFYAGRTHNIIANKNCWLGAEENEQILECVLKFMEKHGISAYDETTGKGLVRHVLIRKGFSSGEIMVCLILNLHKKHGSGQFLPGQNELINDLTEMKGMKSVSVNINTQRTNVIMGEEIHTIWGSDMISDTIHVRDMKRKGEPFTGEALTFHISPLSFYQVNPMQTEKLYSLVLEYAALTGRETVWDLYCGIGTISLFLARSAGKVYGVEVVPQAIEDAKENAAANGITNAQFYVGKAEDILQSFCRSVGDAEETMEEKDVETKAFGLAHGQVMTPPDVIVVDPPRKGCDRTCLEVMLRLRPERIVYVSCDSATLARDLKVLCKGGYEVKRVRGVDQFGHTVHVETVCLLSKLHSDQHIEVELQMDKLDLTAAERKATYEEIKDYVLEHSGLKVSNLYIAQIKQKCGIIERGNYNLPK
ncbi:MAG: 23S rRNA (uracil(1939)-C(5))-methyltransferase RlmD, partial [Lachnospiraceae bacterium]|nr:23S rRNA (uracil(1939)-C(5))-methyltransferase RlmD [Lachnospiraceae bacterium]